MASLGPVGALDEHVRLERADDLVRRVFVEDHHGVDRLEREQHLGALGLRRDRTPRALVRAHGSIRVDADDERVAEAPGLLEIADMPGMQQIEHAVGEDDRLSGRAQGRDTLLRRGEAVAHDAALDLRRLELNAERERPPVRRADRCRRRASRDFTRKV